MPNSSDDPPTPPASTIALPPLTEGSLSRKRGIVAVAVLTTVLFFNTLDRMLIAILLEPIKTDLKLSDSQIGLAVGLLFAVCYAGFSIPAARLADRGDRPVLLALLLCAWSTMTMAMAAVNGFAALVIVRMAVGAGESGCHPTNHSLVASYFPPERRGLALGFIGAGGALGVMFAMIAGGAAAAEFGWRATFLIMGAPGILLALVVWRVLPEARRALPVEQRPRATPLVRSIRDLIANRTFLWLSAAGVLCTGGSTGVSTWMAAYFMRTYGLPIQSAGLWLGLVGGTASVVGYVLSGFVGGKTLDWDRTVKLPGMLIIFAGMALMVPFLMPTWRLALLFLVPAMLFTNFWYGAVFATIQNVVPPANRALAVALTLLAMGSLGNGLGPSLAGILSDLLAPVAGQRSLLFALLFMACWVLAGGLCLIRAYRLLRATNG